MKKNSSIVHKYPTIYGNETAIFFQISTTHRNANSSALTECHIRGCCSYSAIVCSSFNISLMYEDLISDIVFYRAKSAQATSKSHVCITAAAVICNWLQSIEDIMQVDIIVVLTKRRRMCTPFKLKALSSSWEHKSIHNKQLKKYCCQSEAKNTQSVPIY